MLNKWMPPGSVVEPLALLRTLAVMNDDLLLTGLDSAWPRIPAPSGLMRAARLPCNQQEGEKQ
jgi:hypothetical protein